MTTKREIVYRLKAGTVVDRALFNALNNEKLVATTAELFADPSKPPMFVDNSLDFFSKKNLMNEVMTAGPNLNLLLEKWEVALTDEQIAAISAFTAVKTFIEETVNKIVPAYSFTDVPGDWSVENNLEIKGARVRRATQDRGYFLTLPTLKRLWLKVSPAWAVNEIPKGRIEVSSDGYRRYTEFELNRIVIGCQRVHRYELEQLALHQKWEFPS